MRTLHTERLTLEPLSARHAEFLFEGLSDPALYRYLEDEPPQSLDALRGRYERLSTRQSPDGAERWWNWAIRITATGQWAGYVQATIAHAEAEIAYVVFQNRWRRGIAREAVTSMLAELAAAGVATITARTDRENVPSRRFLESLGFETRMLPAYMQADGANDVWYVRTT